MYIGTELSYLLFHYMIYMWISPLILILPILLFRRYIF